MEQGENKFLNNINKLYIYKAQQITQLLNEGEHLTKQTI